MYRILTGIQSSGKAHLGNILGAIKPAINLSKSSIEPSFFFIADLHSLTTIHDPKQRIDNTYNIAASWLACGLDVNKDIFYRQSKIPEVCELLWYLSCFTPLPMLNNSHAFKEKSNNLSNVNIGLFTYPVLMSADILLYDSTIIPVGKDQLQHIEICRDIAKSFNSKYPKSLVVPDSFIQDNVITIPGIDGRKMSKSYNNYIDIFSPEKDLRKSIYSIVTDSLPIEVPKNPDNCNIFNIYKFIASNEEIVQLRKSYEEGGLGYGKIKELLYETLISKFSNERLLYNYYINNIPEIEKTLLNGEIKAKEIAKNTISRIKEALGF